MSDESGARLGSIRFCAYMGGLVTAFLGLVWLYTDHFAMAYMPSGYAIVAAKIDMLRRCDVGEVAFLGDSRVEAGIDPRLLPLDGRNFGISQASAVELSVIVERIVGCPVRPREVVVALTPQHFGPLKSFFWPGVLGYGLLTVGDLFQIKLAAWRLGDTVTFDEAALPSEFPKGVRDFLYVVGFPSTRMASLLHARFGSKLSVNNGLYQEAFQAKGFRTHQGEAGEEDDVMLFEPTVLQNALFDLSLERLTNAGISVSILLMPEKAKVNTNYREGYAKYLAGKAEKIRGVRMINFGVPLWPNEYFEDASHLTKAGSTLFTGMLSECLDLPRIDHCDLNLLSLRRRAGLTH